jgi:tRNA(Ile)-lysidine synthase
MNSLIKKIQNTAFQNNLWQKNSKIIVGVSGGPDSTCLLDMLCRLKDKYNLELITAHVNYGLRGKDSQKDEEFVRKLAEKYGIKIYTLSPALSRKRARRNLLPSENNLREIRYAFFEKLRKKNSFDSIAVAHNLDDQVETFLMRIIRGAGLAGLAAMKYKNNKIIRPLLGTNRKEILKYLKENKLKYRIDKTNKSSAFFRNKIRNKLIPYLEENFNPQIKKTIFDASVSIGEDYNLISEISQEAYQKNKELSVKKILSLHPAFQKRVLLQAVEEKAGTLKDIEASHIEELIKALKSTKNKSQIVLFKGLKFIRKGDKVTINKSKK